MKTVTRFNRKENCKYLHRDIQPSIAKASEHSSVDNSEGDNGVEMNNVDQRISDTEEIVGTKEEAIKELKYVEANLKAENATLRQQVEKLQRVATNMYKELKDMKS